MKSVGNLTYVPKIRIERLGGPQRLAYLPAEENPVTFGVHPVGATSMSICDGDRDLC